MEPINPPVQSPQDKAYLRKQMIKFFLFLGVSVGVALWMMIDNIWPASKLIDLQAGWFNGEYYPKLTFGVIWIFVLLAFVVVFIFGDWLWGLIKGKK
ncbi:MAG TPA: hypothetical protein VK809_11660 [Bacteroidia bacterium]|nr:hypothetical protein [Bacteroidia bacterium]